MEAIQWPTEWLRGVLEVCVLRIISRGPTYGYAIASELTSAGLGTLKGGTLYPLLARCEQAGIVRDRALKDRPDHTELTGLRLDAAPAPVGGLRQPCNEPADRRRIEIDRAPDTPIFAQEPAEHAEREPA